MNLPNENLKSQDLFYSGSAEYNVLPGSLVRFPSTLKNLIFTEAPELASITDSHVEEFTNLMRDLMRSVFSRETQPNEPIIVSIYMSHDSTLNLRLNVSLTQEAINFDDAISLTSQSTKYGAIFPTAINIHVSDRRLEEKTNAPNIIRRLKEGYPEWIDHDEGSRDIRIDLQGIINLRDDIIRRRDSFR